MVLHGWFSQDVPIEFDCGTSYGGRSIIAITIKKAPQQPQKNVFEQSICYPNKGSVSPHLRTVPVMGRSGTGSSHHIAAFSMTSSKFN